MNPEEMNERNTPAPDNDPAIPNSSPQSDESAGVVRDTSEDSEKVEAG